MFTVQSSGTSQGQSCSYISGLTDVLGSQTQTLANKGARCERGLTVGPKRGCLAVCWGPAPMARWGGCPQSQGRRAQQSG